MLRSSVGCNFSVYEDGLFPSLSLVFKKTDSKIPLILRMLQATKLRMMQAIKQRMLQATKHQNSAGHSKEVLRA